MPGTQFVVKRGEGSKTIPFGEQFPGPARRWLAHSVQATAGGGAQRIRGARNSAAGAPERDAAGDPWED